MPSHLPPSTCMTPQAALRVCTSMAGTDSSFKSIHILPAPHHFNAFQCVLSKEAHPTFPAGQVLASKQLVPEEKAVKPCPSKKDARVRGKCIAQSCIHKVVGDCKKADTFADFQQFCLLRNAKKEVDGVIIDHGGPCTSTMQDRQRCINKKLICSCDAPVPDTAT